MKNKDIAQLRERLKKDESRLLKTIDSETEELENQLAKTLKMVALAGAGAIAAYGIYRLIAPKPKKPAKARKPQSKVASRVGQSMLSLAIKNLVPIAIDQINKINSHEPAEPARRKKENQ